jgi:hypothetical protein
MFTITKQDSIVVAVTLGFMLSGPLLIPIFYPTSEITVRSEAVSSSSHGNLMRPSVESNDVDGGKLDSQLCKPFRIAPSRPGQI